MVNKSQLGSFSLRSQYGRFIRGSHSIYDREFMAVIEALKTWKYYLMGRHFIIRTDHKSLVYLKHQNLIDSTRVARWLDFLAQYDFEIQYVKGKDNSAADALSRYPEINAIEVNHVILDRMIEKERMYVVVRLVSLFDDVGKVGKG